MVSCDFADQPAMTNDGTTDRRSRYMTTTDAVTAALARVGDDMARALTAKALQLRSRTYTLTVLQVDNDQRPTGIELVDPAIRYDELVRRLTADGLEDAAYIVNSTDDLDSYTEALSSTCGARTRRAHEPPGD
jgi:hypothetical protein